MIVFVTLGATDCASEMSLHCCIFRVVTREITDDTVFTQHLNFKGDKNPCMCQNPHQKCAYAQISLRCLTTDLKLVYQTVVI